MSERFSRCEASDGLPVQSKSPVCLEPDCREKSPADCPMIGLPYCGDEVLRLVAIYF